MEPQEPLQEENTQRTGPVGDWRSPRYAPHSDEFIIPPDEVTELKPRARVLIRTTPGSVGLYNVWRKDTGPSEDQGVWAEPLWGDPAAALRLANGTGPVRALLESRVVVSRVSLRHNNERYVWWCECGTAGDESHYGPEGLKEIRRRLGRHRRDKECQEVCGLGSYANLEARKAWAQVWFRKTRKKGGKQ